MVGAYIDVFMEHGSSRADLHICVATRSIWILAAAALVGCSPSPAVPSPPPPAAASAPVNGNPPYNGFEVVTAIEGPRNCFSNGLWGLLESAHSIPIGPYQLWRSGSDIGLHSVYPIDDGTWSNYVDYRGTIDGQDFTMSLPVSTTTSQSCVDGSEEQVTLTDSLTGTLSGDGKHLAAISVRTFHFPSGDLTVHWSVTFNQQP